MEIKRPISMTNKQNFIKLQKVQNTSLKFVIGQARHSITKHYISNTCINKSATYL